MVQPIIRHGGAVLANRAAFMHAHVCARCCMMAGMVHASAAAACLMLAACISACWLARPVPLALNSSVERQSHV